MSVAQLAQVYAECSGRPAFVAETISALRQLDADIAWRAMWLLLRHARNGRVDGNAVIRVGAEAEGLAHWMARLHCCQLLSRTGCPPEVREGIFPFLVSWTSDPCPFVRAWAMTALATFAHDPEYRREIAGILQHARRDPAKSVQARLRAIHSGLSATARNDAIPHQRARRTGRRSPICRGTRAVSTM